MTFLIKSLAILAAVYAVLVVGTYYLQRRLMYFPDPTRVSPADIDLGNVDEIVLETPDRERVVAWWGRAQAGRPTLLYFHGNAGNLESRSERIRKYMAEGLGVFIMSYRGYGGSTGEPSEPANIADAKLAHDVLAGKGVDPSDIIVYGESLGSGVAVQVAAEKPVGGLILDAPYTSMVDLAGLHYPYLPARWLMTDRYETDRHIRRVKAPLLILHGEADDIIPIELGRRVFEAAPGPKEMATFPGAGHADHYLFGSYDAVYGWIRNLRAPGGARQAAG